MCQVLTSARVIHSCAKSNVLNIKTKTSLLFPLICLIFHIIKAAIKLSVSILKDLAYAGTCPEIAIVYNIFTFMAVTSFFSNLLTSFCMTNGAE